MSKPEINEAEVDFAKEMLADLVPYDDPNYEKRLDEMTRSAIMGENDPEFIAMCEEHDRMMEADSLEQIQRKSDEIRQLYQCGLFSEDAQEKARQIISSLGNI